jgi:lipopolysaccharide export LptBFGC system permease protein LptF
MLTAGQSLIRVTLPLFVVGVMVTGVSLLLNYQLAPHAEQNRKVLMDKITKGRDASAVVDQKLYRNRQDYRTWFVEAIDKTRGTARKVDITQQDANGEITAKYYADRAVYHPEDHSWVFSGGKMNTYNKDGSIAKQDLSWLRGSKRITGWSETIWRILSTNADPQDLSVSELREYISNNGDFPAARLAAFRTYLWYRFAVPFQCLVVIFIATPLGIVFSRRGVLAGVASSIFIFAAMGFMDKLFLVLGKGYRIPPVAAAWSADVVFALIGCYLLYLRSNNRDVPRLGLWRRG